MGNSCGKARGEQTSAMPRKEMAFYIDKNDGNWGEQRAGMRGEDLRFSQESQRGSSQGGQQQ